MTSRFVIRRRALAGAVAASALALGACQSVYQQPEECCYKGAVAAVPLESLYLELEDGNRLAFGEVFEGFEPDAGLFGLTYPIRSAEIRRVTYENLERALFEYDANGDELIEQPELAVLYVREAAIGMGYNVTAVGINPHVGALSLSQADQSGLIRYVRANVSSFAPAQAKVFAELEMLGTELRPRGRSHEDLDGGPIFPNR